MNLHSTFFFFFFPKRNKIDIREAPHSKGKYCFMPLLLQLHVLGCNVNYFFTVGKKFCASKTL